MWKWTDRKSYHTRQNVYQVGESFTLEGVKDFYQKPRLRLVQSTPSALLGAVIQAATSREVYSLPSTCLSSTLPTWSQPLLTLSSPRSCKIHFISPLLLVLPLHVNFQSIFTFSKLKGKVGKEVMYVHKCILFPHYF